MFFKVLIFNIIFNTLEVYSLKNETVKATKRQDMNQFKSCFESLGCLNTNDEWFHSKYRPRNLEPLDRHTIRTEFILITKDSDEKPLNYDTVSMGKNHAPQDYCKSKGLTILIHDFTSNGYTGWVKHIATALLNKAQSNVISVDWEAGAEPPFEQAIANARVVALEINAFLNMLKNSSSLQEERIHIIGHGVGAHIAGYVGTSTKIGKITGLDPTGPFFEKMPPIVRLDQNDARYVEVLHTDAFNGRSQGAHKSLGHADFYINGAKAQPLCNQSTEFPVFTKIDRNTLKEGVILPACSHKRAFKYYIEALETTDCEFTGIGCESYEQFTEGKCTSCTSEGNTSTCATFGLKNGIPFTTYHNFYTSTRGESPFCLNSYRIKILFEENSKAKKHQEGTFEIIMVDGNGILVNASANYIGSKSSTHTFESGKTHTLIFYGSPPKMHDIIEARLKWIHNPNSLCVAFCNTSVYVKKMVIKLLSASHAGQSPVNRLCPARGKTEIENGSFVIFIKCPDKGIVPGWTGNSTSTDKPVG